MGDILSAVDGQDLDARDFIGPTSYPSGGFSARSDLGRVDVVFAKAQAGNLRTSEVVQDDNAVVITVYSQDSGNELAAGTDLSGETFSSIEFRQ